jgi:hypothetical protein
LQEIINKLAEITVERGEYMDEKTYVNIDNNLRRNNILSFKEIVDFVKNEKEDYIRSHKRKSKDAKIVEEGYLLLLYIYIYIFFLRVHKKKVS